MSEAELQDAVIQCARLFGWRVAHFRSVPVKLGERVVWQTPVQADGKGFPDLVLVRERVLFVELKAQRGVMSGEQMDWMEAMGRADAEYKVWRPKEWDDGTIEETLREQVVASL